VKEKATKVVVQLLDCCFVESLRIVHAVQNKEMLETNAFDFTDLVVDYECKVFLSTVEGAYSVDNAEENASRWVPEAAADLILWPSRVLAESEAILRDEEILGQRFPNQRFQVRMNSHVLLSKRGTISFKHRRTIQVANTLPPLASNELLGCALNLMGLLNVVDYSINLDL